MESSSWLLPLWNENESRRSNRRTFPPNCSALSQVTIHGLKIYWMCAMRLLAVPSSSLPLCLPVSCSFSVCSLALGIECLFIFKHHKKYSSRRQATTMAGCLWVCTLQHTHTHRERLNDIFALCPLAEAAAIFTPFCVVPSQAEPSVICGPGTLSIALVPQLLRLLLLLLL